MSQIIKLEPGSAGGSPASNSTRHFCPDKELAAELLNTYGSPLYVYDAGTINSSIRQIENSFRYKKTRFAFAAVTNGNLTLLKLFRSAGWGLHANSPGDAYLGIAAGFNGKDIIYSGSNLSDEEIELMLNWGVATFNLDSIDQLHSLVKILNKLGHKKPGSAGFQPASASDIKLGFRLNLPSITGETRTGISPEKLIEAQALAESFGLRISGVHFYRGTSTNATERFTEAFSEVIAAAAQLKDFEYLDFGGGFGFPYHDRKHSFDWQIFADELEAALKRDNLDPDLIIEPGRSVIAGSACLLCSVISSKWQDQKQIVGVDTSTSNIAVLSVHGGTRQVESFKETNSKLHASDICGNTTYSRDYLARNCRLPELRTGDKLAILDAGAYGYSMSSHFLARPKAAEVLIENGKHRLIRKREDWQCLLSNQVEEAICQPESLIHFTQNEEQQS